MYNEPLLAQYASSSGAVSLNTPLGAPATSTGNLLNDWLNSPIDPGSFLTEDAPTAAEKQQVQTYAQSVGFPTFASFVGASTDAIARDTVFVLLALVLVAVGAFALVEG